MKKQNFEAETGPRVVWDNLEEWARGRIQGALQDVLEEEVTELLGLPGMSVSAMTARARVPTQSSVAKL